MKVKLLLLVIAVQYNFYCYSQSLVNQDTVTYHGATDTLDYLPLLITTNGNIVVAGNSKISSTQYNAETSAQVVDGFSTWQNSFNSSNQKAFITASTTDDNGNIYTVGGMRLNNNLDFDY